MFLGETCTMSRTAALKRYNWRVLQLSLAYGVLVLIAVYCFKHQLVPAQARYGLAILPALPIIGIFFSMGRYLVEEQDEYVRMLMVRQVLWATGITLSAATIWGFLQTFDLVGNPDGYWIALVWFLGLGFGKIANMLTLGDSSC